MDNTQATTATSSVQAIELTPEVVNAVLQHLAETHQGLDLGGDDVAAHVSNGGRGLAAGHYAAECIRRNDAWREVQATIKRHVVALACDTIEERIAVAKLSGLLAAVEPGWLEDYEEGAREELREALHKEATRLDHELPDSLISAAWDALIEMAVYLDMGADETLCSRAWTALDGAAKIAACLFHIDPVLADQLVADLRELAGKGAKNDAS